MKGNHGHSETWRIVVVVAVLFLLVAGFVVVRGNNNPKPTITISLLSEVDLVTNRVATLVLSNSGPGSIAIDSWNTNVLAGGLYAYSETGEVDSARIPFSVSYRVKILEPGETVQFVVRIPAAATKWRFNSEGRDPSRVDLIMESPARVEMLDVIYTLPVPGAFFDLVEGESKWRLKIESPWFGPNGVSSNSD